MSVLDSSVSRGTIRAMGFTYPILLEAILRAEEAILDIKLQARRALQSASLVGAVGADAHALLLCGCSHIADDVA